MSVSILLADDHGVLLSGIQLMLTNEADWSICAACHSGEEAVAAASKHEPDIAIMDISMPGIGGIEAAKQMKAASPQTKILMLSMYSEEDYLRRALEAGASGYVLKKAVDTELIGAVKTVLAGETYIYPSLTPYLLKTYMPEEESEQSAAGAAPELSEREEEVLRQVALGYTYREIAEKLYVSVKTVETHKARLSEKLGLKKRSELVRYAVAAGMVDFSNGTNPK
ncbi:response regulator [Salisediminibacterium halotolerans]|uniref:Two-component system, NarL family, response regulator NreC n=1 Tax=Salisediminibacterium halotolerans TaxID=517425 RepID=A0A1H9U8Z0_9BACI|nr:response regulator transcription factor [Salisediminibacterium haloalkalitolerans]SES05573.1 two-component system, NarL family, response regulator NreC [Salisediminibacterium haloalkalitolerans]